MRVALIYTPYKPHTVFSENISVVDENFCFGPPIILAYVAALIEKSGHEVMLLDAHVLSLSYPEILARVRAFGPDLLGFRFESYHFHESRHLAGYLKEHLGIPVMGGGINITLYPRESLTHTEIDYGFIGEVFYSVPRFLDTVKDQKEFASIPGLVYRDNGQIIVNKPDEQVVDFSEYPFPARHHLPHDRYSSFVSQRKNYSIVLTSVGCPFNCTFCVISKIPYRERDPINVVDELEECYHRYGIREVDFFDGALFVNKERIIRMCQEMRRRKLDIDWSCRSRVDIVDEVLLQEAAHAGCRRVFYGIETASEETLKKINKEVTIPQIIKTISLSRKAGIQPLGFFMVGNPGETSEAIHDSIEFAKRLKLSYVQVCRSIAKPRTLLDESVIKHTGRDYWREYILDETKAARFPTPWTTFSHEELIAYTKKFYRSFYLRPAIVFERLCKLRSFSELKRYVRIALKMLFS